MKNTVYVVATLVAIAILLALVFTVLYKDVISNFET